MRRHWGSFSKKIDFFKNLNWKIIIFGQFALSVSNVHSSTNFVNESYCQIFPILAATPIHQKVVSSLGRFKNLPST
jgi:hypothetical protein